MSSGYVVSVPFQLAEKIYKAHKKGVPVDALAVIGDCTVPVIEMIIKHQKRIAMRKKYAIDDEKEPA